MLFVGVAPVGVCDMNDAQQTELTRIRALIERGHYDDALQSVITLQQSVEGSTGALTFLLRGLALCGLAQPDRAERSFRMAYSIVRYAPDSEVTAQRILGAAAERLGLRDEAIAAYRAVLRGAPDDTEARSGLDRLATRVPDRVAARMADRAAERLGRTAASLGSPPHETKFRR
jgi:tetratricopeptide (TPR) repeat protein